MLIDRTHRGWILATGALAVAAVALYVAAYRATPGGLTGGDPVGLLYGIAGSALMAFAGALSLHRRVPSWWWIGRRQTWLRGHVWLGLLSGVLILCHSAGRFGGPLEQFLMAVTLLVLGTGVLGLGLQFALPRLMTVRVTAEAPYDQIPHLCEALRRQCDKAVAEGAKGRLEGFYNDEVRPFLAARYGRESPLAHPLRAEALFDEMHRLIGRGADEPPEPLLRLLKVACEERRELGEQERLQFWLHSWLLVHVPLSAVLLVLGLVHAVMSLYY